MTVKELIEALQKMPPDADVYYNDGPAAGYVFSEEIEPRPSFVQCTALTNDDGAPAYPHGRVRL